MTQRRSIFEEVGAPQATPKPAPSGGSTAREDRARRAARIWLWMLFGLVALMVAVGGLTRLTGSGLSITEWRPISGALPPLTAEDWAAEFDRYREIPQYQLLNQGMSLAEFQVIYWWEWGHRQLGRLVGLVWALGLLVLWLSRRLPRGWAGRFVVLGALGGLQGAIGWCMVASGLTEGMLAVAAYRLAVHLGLAFVILGLIWWYILRLGRSAPDLMQARRAREGALAGWGGVLVAGVFLQIVIGALVAGNAAGRVYVDWPLMHGVFFPPEALELEPVWRNAFENPAMVQFAHRMAGYALVVLGLVVWALGWRSPHPATRKAAHWLALVLLGQVALGIVTLMHGAPLALALAHQLLGLGLWVVVLRLRHLALYPRMASLRGGVRG